MIGDMGGKNNPLSVNRLPSERYQIDSLIINRVKTQKKAIDRPEERFPKWSVDQLKLDQATPCAETNI